MNEQNTNEVVVVDLTATGKKKFRINLGDNSNKGNDILELNTSDLNIVKRLNENISKLEELSKDAQERLKVFSEISDKSTTKTESLEEMQKELSKVTEVLVDIDTRMRNIIDNIFDTNVCDVCCPSGSMYDPLNGKIRYEYILETITSLLDTGYTEEFSKLNDRIKTITKSKKR